MEPTDLRTHRGAFFKILTTTEKSQAGVMTIDPDGDSGPEDMHPGDQIVHVIEGTATVAIGGREHVVPSGAIITIPSGARHHIYNRQQKTLFLLTMYAPPAY